MRRRNARRSLVDFIQYVSPWWKPQPYHVLLCEKLEAVERGDIKRLMVMMPPRHGKSEITSVHFPAWYIGRNPDNRLIASTYGKVLTERFSRRCRNLVESDRYHNVFPDVRLAKDSKSVTQWDLALHRGGFLASSVGSAITGMGADMGLIDDPIKGFEAAESELQRDSTHEWYLNDFYTRIEGDGPIVLTNTRWNEDDLSGRLLADTEGDPWDVLKLAALAEDPDDPLGRAPGEPLWPTKYTAKRLEAIRNVMGDRRFGGLYQQRPRGQQGNLFKAEWFEEEWIELPRTIERVITFCDSALKEKQINDEWAWLTLAIGKDGMSYLLNLTHGRYAGPDAEDEAVKIARRCLKAFGHQYQAYVEDTAGGAAMIRYAARNNPDLTFVPVQVDKDKVSRANGVLKYCEARRVRLPARNYPWKDALMSQLLDFPFGAHDDRVDAFVGALTVAMQDWAPIDASSGATDAGAPSWL